MPNYLEYHKSLTDELHALKNRIRDLSEHWPTDGEFKEAALRTVLRRHLPSSLIVGRGFIVTASGSSTQLDLLIVDGTKPTLFRDGDLMIVTPDCVRAVIEVKTSLDSYPDVEECAMTLAKIGRLCKKNGRFRPWLGIFSYEGPRQHADLLLNSLAKAHRQTGVAINCFAYGKDCFIRFWKRGEREMGDHPNAANVEKWRAYDLEHLASAYFVGNVVDSLTTLNNSTNAFAWYPLTDGKRPHMEAERLLV